MGIPTANVDYDVNMALPEEGVYAGITLSLIHIQMCIRDSPNRDAQGTVIEAEIDKGRGPVATVLVQNGTLTVSYTHLDVYKRQILSHHIRASCIQLALIFCIILF